MDISRLLKAIKKWWWLVVAATVIAGISSFVVAFQQPSTYTARTTLIIGQALRDPNPNQGQFYLEQQLAAIYADIALRTPIQKATMETLGLTWLPLYEVRAIPNTPLIEILTTDTDAQRAQAVTNTIAQELIDANSTNSPTETAQQQFILKQLDEIQQAIVDTQIEIQNAKIDLASLTNARTIADKQIQIDALGQKLTLLQGNFATLRAQSTSGAVNSLRIIEPAEVPVIPDPSNIGLITGLSAAIGLMLALMATYVIESLDTTVKDSEEISQSLNLPIIGKIPALPTVRNPWTYVADHPQSGIADDFRLLRTNLDFFNVGHPLRTILISSPDSNDGKSMVATNLASIMTQNNRKVILVDMDLRNSTLYASIGINSEPELLQKGMSDLIANPDIKIEDVLIPVSDNLFLLPAGTLPPNPTELVGSNRVAEILTSLTEKADVVILDGPPFIVADATVLAARADGVLIVASLGHTRKASIQGAKDQITRSGAKILGIVINRAASSSSYYRYTGKRADVKSQPPASTDMKSRPLASTESASRPLPAIIESAKNSIQKQPRNPRNRPKNDH